MSDWSDDRVEMMKSMWAEGASCSQIARALGGTTRSAVIGKLNRLGYTRDPSVCRQPRQQRGPSERQAPAPRVPRARADPKIPHPEPLGAAGDFSTGCQYIHGDPGVTEWRMCGHPAKGRWCDFHAQRVVA